MRFPRIRSIRARLTLMIGLLLITFVVFLGLLYNTLLRRQMIEHHLLTMQRHAYTISQNLSELLAPSGYDGLDETRFLVSEDTLAPYLTMTEGLTSCNVYIVDTDHNITGNFDGVVQRIENPLLPAWMEQAIAHGFMGKTPSVQAHFEGNTHLTACMPVTNTHSQVLGVVLLENNLRQLGYSETPTMTLLITSTLIALVSSLMLAFVLSLFFTHPISRVRRVAQELTDGHYEARTQVTSEDEIGLLASSMDTLADRLQEAQRINDEMQRQQQQMFSNISHELRTPVTVIRGSLEALRDGMVVTNEEKRSYYDQMIRESDWLKRLIRDLLELSRLQNSEYVLDEEEFELTDLMGDVAMSCRAMCESKGILFECAEPSVSYRFRGDYARLRQMLLAVADNAVKFTAPGKTVRIRLKDEQPCLCIEDEGKGIPEEELAHIFDRFHSSREPGQEGTGLGLAIVREVARRHNIALDVNSVSGQGTVFSFTFPFDNARPAVI